MAASNGLGKTLGVLALVAVGVFIGFVVGWGWSAFLAPFLASVLGTKQLGKAPDLKTVEADAKAQVLAESPGAVVDSLDPDTRAGIDAIKTSVGSGTDAIVDDALAQAQRLSATHQVDAGGVQSPDQGSSGQGTGGGS